MDTLDLVVVGIEIDSPLLHEFLRDRLVQTGEQVLILSGVEPLL